MSRTHFISKPTDVACVTTDTHIKVSDAHIMADAVERNAKGSDLLFNPLPLNKTVFEFDVLAHVRTITSEVMRKELLNSLAFSTDAHINVRLGMLLSQFYKAPVDDASGEVKPWATYHDFLDHIKGMEANHQLLVDMGIDAVDNHSMLKNLYILRQECHRLLADGKSDYQTPDLEDFINNPRMRSTTALTYLKWEDLAEDEAEGDAELKAEVLDAYQLKAKAKALQSLNYDKQRAGALIMLYRAFGLDKLDRDISYQDDYCPFDELPIDLQYKLMQGARRAMNKFIDRAAEDNKVEAIEFAKFRKERKPYLKTLDAALAHPRFADCV